MHPVLIDIPRMPVKQSAAITPLNGRSVIPLFGAGIMSVIASGMWTVSFMEMSIPATGLPSGGPRCQAATCVAWHVNFRPECMHIIN